MCRPYFDIAPLFTGHTGSDKTIYMSGSALCAGWVLLVVCNALWLMVVLGWDLDGDSSAGRKKKEGPAPPITGAVTGTENVQVHVGRP